MVHGEGAPKGPDLSDVGSRLTAQEINSVLLHPDQHITAGYGLASVTLRNGQTLRGFARGRTNFSVQSQDLDGAFHLLQSHDIVSIADDPHSRMRPLNAPPDPIQNLTAYSASSQVWNRGR